MAVAPLDRQATTRRVLALGRSARSARHSIYCASHPLEAKAPEFYQNGLDWVYPALQYTISTEHRILVLFIIRYYYNTCIYLYYVLIIPDVAASVSMRRASSQP